MAKKRIIINRKLRGQEPEPISLDAALNSVILDLQDTDNQERFNKHTIARNRMTLSWLVELLLSKGLLDESELADLPILNKINGDTLEVVDL